MNTMLKGNRTYLTTAGGVFAGLGMMVNSYLSNDYSTLSEGLTLFLVSLAQFFQRASTKATME